MDFRIPIINKYKKSIKPNFLIKYKNTMHEFINKIGQLSIYYSK